MKISRQMSGMGRRLQGRLTLAVQNFAPITMCLSDTSSFPYFCFVIKVLLYLIEEHDVSNVWDGLLVVDSTSRRLESLGRIWHDEGETTESTTPLSVPNIDHVDLWWEKRGATISIVNYFSKNSSFYSNKVMHSTCSLFYIQRILSRICSQTIFIINQLDNWEIWNIIE